MFHIDYKRSVCYYAIIQQYLHCIIYTAMEFRKTTG